MKVLVLSSLAYSLTNFRGALLRELKANGHHVVAVAPDGNAAVEAELANWGVGFRIVPMDRTGTSLIGDAALLAAYTRLMVAEKPDLVLAYTQKPIIYGGIAARLMCVPRFYAMMSGLGYVFSEAAAHRRLLRRAVARLYREAVRRARGVFVFNADDRQDMIDLGIVHEHQNVVRVPGSGVDLERFALAPLPRGRMRFLLVGRLMRDKGVQEFLEAAALIRRDHADVEFCILGHYETANPTGIDEVECARLSRQFPVQFIPGTSDVRPYLASCSVFVLPSYYREGLPRTILEAMATGRPVITTDMPGCRDPIIEGENGFLISPRDTAALRRAMQRFIDDPELVARMGARSRSLAEKVYDVRKVNHQLLDEMDLLREPWNVPDAVSAARGVDADAPLVGTPMAKAPREGGTGPSQVAAG
ncbi:glycosyltransferase involved in cell wall biosynthesis [Novosphingobium sp. PhB165]|uniref:glycosyltransferase family 4 protein n=1 Tax=Novosphingobium sp. PhB165 TaxID=2485105 RepID=UPI001051A649|nr:glycosyltransferase family 4 protein [Novosphingobium sp. PhB165]TCM21376.1 glycosyltransferase involved in cell wall biosynthesis [Novosphingobium sp. PhB165]